MSLPHIHIGRPQRLAALLLLVFFAECLYVVAHQQLSTADYRFASCGRALWEHPATPAQDSCGNLNADGAFAYRVVGLPLTAQRLALLAADHLRAPTNRLYSDGSLNGSTWESRHQLAGVVYLIHLPFVLFAVWMGGGLWWVSRRLFGNEGGFFALGLYCFCPTIVRLAVTPNNDLLAMWGLYGLVYTAIGVAHAMQGPRRKWRPRIVLLTVALGLTAAAHLMAAIAGLAAAIAFMLYLAERRRRIALQILTITTTGALAILFISSGFHWTTFSDLFSGRALGLRLSIADARAFANSVNLPILTAIGISALLYCTVRRSRYFGNTAPLLMVLALAPLVTPQAVGEPWLWALPFLFTFAGGVFADALETGARKLFLVITGAILTAQAIECLIALPLIAR